MSNYEARILVNNRPVKKFLHKNNFFIEGRKGSEYVLEFVNYTSSRVEVVVSVDGLSVTDGKPCTPNTMGYLVEPRSSIKIDGWRLNNQSVASFKFNDEKESYSTQMTNSSKNTGVIGFMVFDEKVKIVQPTVIEKHIHHHHYDYTWNDRWNWPYRNNSPLLGSGMAVADTFTPSTASMAQPNPNIKSAASSFNISNSVAGASASLNSISTESLSSDENDSMFGLGTEFGKEKSSFTSEVEFDRRDKNTPTEILQIFYDSRKGLEKRGIEVVRNSKQKIDDLPVAFTGYSTPVTGCIPPKNWKKNKRK